jgi:hypothetical protein
MVFNSVPTYKVFTFSVLSGAIIVILFLAETSIGLYLNTLAGFDLANPKFAIEDDTTPPGQL